LHSTPAGLSPEQWKPESGTGLQLGSVLYNKKLQLKTLDSHKWLSQRCLKSKCYLKCLGKSSNLKLSSTMGLEEFALKMRTLLGLIGTNLCKISKEKLACELSWQR